MLILPASQFPRLWDVVTLYILTELLRVVLECYHRQGHVPVTWFDDILVKETVMELWTIIIYYLFLRLCSSHSHYKLGYRFQQAALFALEKGLPSEGSEERIMGLWKQRVVEGERVV